MCGRYALDLSKSKNFFKQETINKNKEFFQFNSQDVAPSMHVPIIIFKNNKYNFITSRWGLSFEWLKNKLYFNSRSETVLEKNFSNDLVKKYPCLVPFNSYFEWKNIDNKKKEKYEICHENEQVSFFAGFCSSDFKEHTILTTSASESTKDIHHRIPILVLKNEIVSWFKSEDRVEKKIQNIFYDFSLKKS